MKNLLLSCIFLVFSGIGFAQAPAIQWKKCLGGSEDDVGFAIRELPSGDFFIAGYTSSHNGDVHSNTGNFEHMWLIKSDFLGNIIWENSYGGTWGPDLAFYMNLTKDGGTILIG